MSVGIADALRPSAVSSAGSEHTFVPAFSLRSVPAVVQHLAAELVTDTTSREKSIGLRAGKCFGQFDHPVGCRRACRSAADATGERLNHSTCPAAGSAPAPGSTTISPFLKIGPHRTLSNRTWYATV